MTKEVKEFLMRKSKDTLVKLCDYYSHQADKFEKELNEAKAKIEKLERVIERGNGYNEL